MESVFQIICVDTSFKVKVKNELNLLHLLFSYGELWKNAELKDGIIAENDNSLICSISKMIFESTDNAKPQTSYNITFKGCFEELPDKRLMLLEFISSQNFDKIYVIKDDISQSIACELYSLINELETLLRGYLIKFFITKLGIKWWDITADSEMKQKATKRKNNEMVFSKYIDNKIYLIDFGELGKIVYDLSSGFINKDDIVSKLLNIEDSVEALKNLKSDLQSNYNKYFKDTFKDKQFQKKWEEIEKLRHKVAHNNLFTQEDLKVGKKCCEELKQIIEVANQTVDKLKFTDKEIENIVDSSLNNINELYGDFINAWKLLESQVLRIAKSNGIIAEGKKYSNSNITLNELKKREILDATIFKQIELIYIYRNNIVHTPINEFSKFELELPEQIRLTQSVIKELMKK